MAKSNYHPRHMTRRLVLQALYQFQLNASSEAELKEQFTETTLYTYADGEYFEFLLHGILQTQEELNSLILPFLNIPLKDLDPVEHSVLWLSAFELKNSLDIPYRVVINEALELNKSFGSVDGHKFVNGVLDQLAKELRSVEIAAYKDTH